MKNYVNGACHCELNTFRVEIDRDSSLADELCHCNTCRHTTGQMAVHYTSISGPPLTRLHETGSREGSEYGGVDDGAGQMRTAVSPNETSELLAPPTIEIIRADDPYDLGDLTAYKTSPGVTRYFCTLCSAQLFYIQHRESGDNKWSVAAGSLQNSGWKNGYHKWVGDTLDGGFADHLKSINGTRLPRFAHKFQSMEVDPGWKDEIFSEIKTNPLGQDMLKAHCNCGAIKFAIIRPSDASFEPQCPYPDMLYSHLYSHVSKISNPKDEKWWLRPPNSSKPTKYLAGHCLCNTCRLNSGFEVQSWSFIPLANIVNPETGIPLTLKKENQRLKNLKQYISSTGNFREFCEICGATAFSWQAVVPDLVSVSIGLFDEKADGTKGEDWFDWHTNRIGFQESAVDQLLAKALQAGLKED